MPFDRRLFLNELGRKAFHLAGCVIPIAYYFFVPRPAMAIILFLCVIGAGFLEYRRLTGRDLYPTTFMRPSEERRIGGYFYAAVALFLAVLCFDKTVAIAAMLFLIVGDALTGLAGAIYFMYSKAKPVDARETRSDDLRFVLGHPKPPALVVLMFLLCMGIGLLFYPALPLRATLVGALGATVADAFPWRLGPFAIDDNLSIPLVAGALMTLAALV